MATVSELFVAVFATASLVLVTAILIGRHHGQPLKSPRTENTAPRIDDIPADHTDSLDRNPKSIAEQDPILRRDAALAPKHKKSLTLRIDDIPADHTDNLDRNLKSILEEVPDLWGDADTMVRRSLVPYGKDSLCATVSIITSLSVDDLSAQLRRAGNSHPYSYDFTALDGKEKWTAYRFTKNVYDAWMPAHFKKICSAINQLPANLDFDVPSLPETGLSQDLESHHLSQSDADTVSLPAEEDSQSSNTGQEKGTPGTSFTNPGAAKRRKGRKK